MATAGGAKCIVLSGDARMVDTVIVNGEIVGEKGRLLRIDEWQKSAYADEISHELLQRASKNFPALQEEIISSVQESTGGAL